jgi:hypothetical protein
MADRQGEPHIRVTCGHDWQAIAEEVLLTSDAPRTD